jgi:hypothetical protein
MPSIPNKWRWRRTKVDFWAMFIKAVSIGPARVARKGSRLQFASRLWMFSAGAVAQTEPGLLHLPGDHSILMPASRTTLLHLSMSPLIWAANSSGVLPTGENPSAVNACCMSGSNTMRAS